MYSERERRSTNGENLAYKLNFISLKLSVEFYKHDTHVTYKVLLTNTKCHEEYTLYQSVQRERQGENSKIKEQAALIQRKQSSL